MKREHIFTLLLALLVVIALVQTFQLTGLKARVTTNAVVDLSPQPVAQEPAVSLPENISAEIT